MCGTRFQIFFSTFLVRSGTFFLLGALSRIKSPMAEELSLSESFLGILDALLFGGSAIGYVYNLVFPFKRPLLAATIYSILMGLSIQLQLLTSLFPSLAEQILILSRMSFGFFFVALVFSQSVITHYFNSDEDQTQVQIWFASSYLGDVFGILMCELLIENVGLNWKDAMTCCVIGFILCCIYMFLVVEQTPIQSEGSQQLSSFRELSAQYYSKKVNLFHTINFIFLASLYYLMILWLPYFFSSLGFHNQSSYISITYPIGFVAGVLLFQPFREKFKKHLKIILMSMMLFNNLSAFGLCTLNDDPSHIPFYYVFIVLATLSYSGVAVYTRTTDLKNRAANNHQFLMVNSANHFLLRIAQIITFLTSGILMEKNVLNLTKMFFVIACICSLLLALRLYYFKDNTFEVTSAQTRQEEQN